MIKFLYFYYTHVIFRIHCFHDYEGQRCQDLEISYLIECEKSSIRSTLQMQRKLKQNNIQCVDQPHVTYPLPETSTSKASEKIQPHVTYPFPETSTSKATEKIPYCMLIYLLISYVG